MDYGPFIRIALRYVVGGAILGSQALGDQLAADKDLVSAIAVLVGLCVEFAYVRAKKTGGAT